MTIEQAKEILAERAKLNRKLVDGIQSEFDAFLISEAEAIELILGALE